MKLKQIQQGDSDPESDDDDHRCAHVCSAHRCVSQADARRPECAACAACQMRPGSRRLGAQAQAQAQESHVMSLMSFHSKFLSSPVVCAYVSGLTSSFLLWGFVFGVSVSVSGVCVKVKV